MIRIINKSNKTYTAHPTAFGSVVDKIESICHFLKLSLILNFEKPRAEINPQKPNLLTE